jgi:dihydroorotate dehydrogenase electron transfer subunit
MRLSGAHATSAPGQFVQVALDGFYLRRPISVCDYDDAGFSIAYKVVGGGTLAMSGLKAGARLDIITGLGNGYNLSPSRRPLIAGGGAGVPPLYALAKRFRRAGLPVTVIMGFNADEDVFFEDELSALGCEVHTVTALPGRRRSGLVTDLLGHASGCDYYYACGPQAMLRALWAACPLPGQLSLEARMACGFGACMGCSCQTSSGPRRICADGPVFGKEEVAW